MLSSSNQTGSKNKKNSNAAQLTPTASYQQKNKIEITNVVVLTTLIYISANNGGKAKASEQDIAFIVGCFVSLATTSCIEDSRRKEYLWR